MMENITEDLNNINEAVVNEKILKEESEAAIFDMLKDVVNRVKIELENEKRNRFFFFYFKIVFLFLLFNL